MKMYRILLFSLLLFVCAVVHASGTAAMTDRQQAGMSSGHGLPDDKGQFERRTALQISQSVVGNSISDFQLKQRDGSWMNLSDMKGKPLLISLVYTSCYHICPTSTKHLAKAVEAAADALGRDNFQIITIGFDSLRDTPPMMAQFSGSLGITDEDWLFLSADQETIGQISLELGFIFYPSPHGFDHLIQVSLLDREQKLLQQVYGMQFELPLLIEPLKQIVFNEPGAGLTLSLANKLLAFCTVYDPAVNKYRFDYSVFIGTFIGFMCVLLVGLMLVKEWRKTLRVHSGKGV